MMGRVRDGDLQVMYDLIDGGSVMHCIKNSGDGGDSRKRRAEAPRLPKPKRGRSLLLLAIHQDVGTSDHQCPTKHNGLGQF